MTVTFLGRHLVIILKSSVALWQLDCSLLFSFFPDVYSSILSVCSSLKTAATER